MSVLYFAKFFEILKWNHFYHIQVIKIKGSSAEGTRNYTNIQAFAEVKYLEMLTFLLIFDTYFLKSRDVNGCLVDIVHCH